MSGGLSPEQVIELKHGLAGIAEVTRTLYVELQGQGFSDDEALRLTGVWLTAVTRGSFGGEAA